jgi:hypothetical protein
MTVLVVGGLLHLALVAVAIRYSGHTDRAVGTVSAVARESSPRVPVVGDRVTCPASGAPNEVGYRYCGACMADLPGVGVTDDERAGRPHPLTE